MDTIEHISAELMEGDRTSAWGWVEGAEHADRSQESSQNPSVLWALLLPDLSPHISYLGSITNSLGD